MKRRLAFFLLLSLFFFIPLASAAITKPFDHSAWDQLLRQFVNEEGDVNYAALKKDPVLLETYLKKLRKIKWIRFRDWPREESLALWLNVYHAALIKNVLKYYPIKTVHEPPGFWEEDVVDVGKRLFGLNEIRTRFLLSSFRDAKIHAVLSYAAKGGPKLPREAFVGPTVDGQLFQATRTFVNDSKRNQIIPEKKTVKVSKLFEWYASDFNMDFGVYENDRGFRREDFAVLSFFVYHLEDEEKVRFLEEMNYKIKYFPFNWTLNDWKA